MLQYIVLVGAAAQFVGIFIYIKGTIQGKIKPNKVTWLMWSIAPLIATAAALSTGVRWAAVPVFMSGFGPLLVFIFSFVNPKSYWKLEKFDYFCGAFSILALVLWAVTKEPVIAIIFAIASDASAALPIIIKSWKHPDSERPEAFMAGMFSALTSFFVLKTFSFSEIAFPVYLVLVCAILIISGYRGRILSNKLLLNKG